MLLVFDDEHRIRLQLLQNLDKDVISQFCGTALGFILKGVSPRTYQNTADNLNVNLTVIQQGIEGLMYLFTESAKFSLSELDFQTSIITLEFSETVQNVILQHYKDHSKEIRNVLLGMSMGLSHYRDLEWRCDVKVASRSLHHQIKPTTLLKLTTSNNNIDIVKHMECDIPNLIHLTEVLEQALQEAKSQRCQRLKRQIK